MSYNNSPVMPNKYLLPDGSITTFAGVEWAAADSDRADTYKQMQWQAAKWLMPDGSIVSAIPISTDSLDAIYVPLTRTINGKPLSANVVLTADDLGIPDPLTYKGVIDCSTNPNYPAADAGHTYLISVAGKIGGASGIVVAVGDMAICKTDGTVAGTQAAVESSWNILEKNVDFGNITITGGTINGVIIGATAPAAGTFTYVNWAKATTIADSATPAIGAALGNVVDLDGTTTITGFDNVDAGITRFVTFNAVRILTYNATSMILPGASNIQTAVNDRAIFISLGSGNWRCQCYLKANGLAVGHTAEEIVAASATITRAQSFGGIVNNFGQTGDAVLTLLAIEKGMNFIVTLGTTVAKYYRIDPSSTDVIILDSVVLTGGKYVGVTTAAQGAQIQFYSIQTGASTYVWIANTISGAWVAEP